MTNILSREDILSADDRPIVPVETPEWGGTVLVRPLSGNERDAYEMSNIDQRRGMQMDLRHARARLVQMCVVDGHWDEEQQRYIATGRMFTKNDVERLGKKSAAALDRVAEVARDASGISEEQEAELIEDFGGRLTPKPNKRTKKTKTSNREIEAETLESAGASSS